MYRHDTVFSVVVAAFALALPLEAGSDTGKPGNGEPPAAVASAGKSFIDWSPAAKLPAWLQLGIQIRGRMEAPSGVSMVNSSSDTYYLSRIRVEIGIKPVSWLRFFAQAQDARVAGYNSAPAPTTIYNPMDLRQGYIALNREGPVNVGLRAGRQELAFGGERVIGPADWGMSRTFDAVDLSLGRGPWKADLFAGSAVLIDNTRFDRHKPGEHLYGAYGSIRKVLPEMNVEPYLLFKQTLLVKSEGGIVGDAIVVSPGVRVFGKAPGRLDYTVEVLVQRDRIRRTGLAPRVKAIWLAGRSSIRRSNRESARSTTVPPEMPRTRMAFVVRSTSFTPATTAFTA